MKALEPAGPQRRWRDWQAMLAAVTGRCPNCRRGKLFSGVYRMHRRCPVCAVRFERDPGAWLGAMASAYAGSILVLGSFATLVILRWGLFPGLEWVLTGAGVLTVVLIWRPAKGWWTWWMWAAGFVTKDGEEVY